MPRLAHALDNDLIVMLERAYARWRLGLGGGVRDD